MGATKKCGQGEILMHYLRTAVLAATLVSFPITASAWKMESGYFTLASTYDVPIFTTVGFTQVYEVTPVVFVIGTSDGGNSADLRIRNLTKTSFQIAAAEPSGQDGPHIEMTVHFLAIEPGQHTLPDGTRIEVGTFGTQEVQLGSGVAGTPGWHDVTFNTPFAFAPVVLAQIQTMNNLSTNPPTEVVEPWLTMAVQNVTTTGVQIAMDRSEAAPGTITIDESIAYLAIDNFDGAQQISGTFNDRIGSPVDYETLVTGNTVVGWTDACTSIFFNQVYAIPPLVMASKRERLEADGGWLRRCDIDTTDVGLLIDEDTFLDAERSHTAEPVSLLIFSDQFTAAFGTNGTVVITPSAFPGDTLTVTVTDPDLNSDPGAQEFYLIDLVNDVTGEIEKQTLFEQGDDSSVFVATADTVFGASAGTSFDGEFNAEAGDTITVTYDDDLTFDGGTASVNDTCNILGGVTATVSITPTAIPGDTLSISLDDFDLNADGGATETFDVEMRNTLTDELETVTLTETGDNTGLLSPAPSRPISVMLLALTTTAPWRCKRAIWCVSPMTTRFEPTAAAPPSQMTPPSSAEQMLRSRSPPTVHRGTL